MCRWYIILLGENTFYQIFISGYDSYKADIYESQVAKEVYSVFKYYILDQFAFRIKLDES